jgi:hypothetical protein
MSPTVCLLFGLSFYLSFTAANSIAGTVEDKALQNFLERPSQQTFLAVSGKNGETVCKEMTSDGPELAKLCDQVSRGNLWAARYLLRYLHKCDGAALEIALIGLGQFGDRDPEQLLDFVRQGMMTPKDLTDAVGTRPLTFVDNDLGTIHFFEARRNKLEQVNRKNLVALKAQALKAVNDSLAEFRSN